MSTIRLSPSFFARELDAYAAWTTAFWRELIQNSVDAGSSKIDITITPLDEEKCEIEIIDDGCGMSREVLENVYFVVGETTKGNGDIGGFGRARIITCFAQESYEISSHDFRAVGCGADYEIEERDSHVAGCTVKVRISKCSVRVMTDSLNRYLEDCQLSLRVTINDVAFVNWANRNSQFAQLGIGTVSEHKTKGDGRVLIRVAGVAMFYRWGHIKGRVVIEIPPEKSRTILTSNRDGFRSEYQGEFDALLERLATETNTGTNPPFEAEKKIFGRPAKTISRVKDESKQNVPEAEKETEMQACRYFSAGQSNIQLNLFSSTATEEESPADYIHLLESGKFRRVADRYLPSKISPKNLKLLAGWDAACALAVNAAMDLAELTSITYSVGFCFSESTKAACLIDSAGYSLLLRPVDPDGKIAFRVSDKITPHQLLALAAHEAAHILYQAHDENFAATMTAISMQISPHYREVAANMRRILAA